MSKILVSVVNYCDPEFVSTVKSLWDQSKNKDNLFFSLVSEDLQAYDFSFIPSSQISYRHFDISEYRGGLCWARNLALDVDFNYDFFMQFDSHTYASKDWDVDAITIYDIVNKKYPGKNIIAHAPANYEYLDDGSIDFNVHPIRSMSAKMYQELIPGFNFPHYEVLEDGEIRKAYWATCCYLFAPKEWVDEVGIDPTCSFNTEEISLSIKTFAKGWNIYSYGTRNTFHHMSHRQVDGSITRQTKRPWADNRRDDYWNHVDRASENLTMLMSGNANIPLSMVQSFFEKTGIDKKYLTYIPNYSSHVVIENRGFGMPPRQL